MANTSLSPSQFSGLSWSTWAEAADKDNINENDEEEPPDSSKDNSDSMKLKRQDMSLYGLCPARDEFFLVVCEKCGQVIKPQALEEHIETKHGGSNSSPNNKPRSKNSVSPRDKRKADSKSSKKNHQNPVVKVERLMPPTVVQQKLNKRTNSSYDSDRPGRPPEIIKTQFIEETVEEELITIKPEELAAAMGNKSAIGAQQLVDLVEQDEVAQAVQALSAIEVEPGQNDEAPKITIKLEDFKTSQHAFDPLHGYDVQNTAYSSAIPKSQQSNILTFDRGKDASSLGDVKMEIEEKHSPPPSIPTPPPSNERQSSPASLAMPPPSFPTPTTTPPDFTDPFGIGKVKQESDIFKIENYPDRSPVQSSNLTMPLVKQRRISHGNTVSLMTVTTTVALTTMASNPFTTATIVVTATSTSSSPSTAVTTPTFSVPKGTKDPRFLPCKDRVYDAEKHCGVWIGESNRHCTRSLTCKTHALSLRRSVKGRSKSFDQLLLDHRAAKEAAAKAKHEASAVAQALKSGHPNVCLSSLSSAVAAAGAPPVATLNTGASMRNLANAHHSSGMAGLISSSSGNKLLKTATSSTNNGKLVPPISQLHKPSQLPMFPQHQSVPITDCSTSRLSSDGEDDDDSTNRDPPDYSYIQHPPRPAAVNGFGAWRHGPGCFTFNRKQDLLRSVFAAAVDKSLYHPPSKKLCTESKLSKAHHQNSAASSSSSSQQASSSSRSDPYDFLTPEAVSNGNPVSQHQPNQAAIQAANTALALANKAAANSLAKSKKTSASGAFSRSIKLTKDLNRATPVCGASFSGTKIGQLGSIAGHATLAAVNSAKRKRSGSASSSSSAPNVSISAMTSANNSPSNPISISIPAMNLTSNAAFNATLGGAKVTPITSVTGGAKLQNINANQVQLKDLNFQLVSTNMDSNTLVNGQIVSLPPGVNLQDIQNHLNSLQPISTSDGLHAKDGKKSGKGGANRISSTIMTIPGNAAVVSGSGILPMGTVTMVSSTTSSPLNNQTAIFTTTSIPNGVQPVGQFKGIPISINHISAGNIGGNHDHIPTGTLINAHNKTPGKAISLTSARGASSVNGPVNVNQKVPLLSAAGTTGGAPRMQIPLSAATPQQLATLSLSGQRSTLLASGNSGASGPVFSQIPFALQSKTGKQGGTKMLGQPVSLTIVSPSNMGYHTSAMPGQQQQPHTGARTLVLQAAAVPAATATAAEHDHQNKSRGRESATPTPTNMLS